MMKRILKMHISVLGIIWLLMQPYHVLAQEKLSGTIVDSKDKAPLPGVTISTQDGVAKSITNGDGKFEISTKKGTLLTTSMVGYQNQTLKASAGMVVVLVASAVNLDDVVILGYGTQKKELVSGSVSTMKMDDTRRNTPTTSLGNLLAGQMAGVDLGTPGGAPGAKPSITIRQMTTFGKNGKNDKKQDALFVIDGMVTANSDVFNNLSPNDIDNVTTLKDAAATAAYGARAAGGVIVITTRRGSKSSHPVINYSFNTGFDVRTKNAPLTSAVQQGELYNRINPTSDPAGWRWEQSDLEYFKNIKNGWGYDQLDAIWHTPTTSSHNLSVSGGGENVRYFMGGSVVSQGSFIEKLNFNKYNFRSNVTVDITKRLEFFAGLSLNNNIRQSPPTNDNFDDWYGKLRVWQPDQPVWTNGGNPIDYGWIMNMGAQVRGDGGYKNSNMLNPTLNLKLTYKIPGIEGLSATAQYNRSITYTREKFFEKRYDVWVMTKKGNRIISTDEKDLVSLKKTSQVGNDYLEEDYTWSDYRQYNLQLSYDRTFNNLHHVGGWLLMEKAQTEVGGARAYRQNFPVYTTDQWWAASQDPNDIDAGGAPKDNSADKNGRKSWVGQFFYDYAGKYLSSFSYRYDGSYRFAPESRWGFFPSGSLGWVISKENFFKNVKGIELLKLRGSTGLTSSDNITAYQWQQTYQPGGTTYFGTNPMANVGIQYGGIVNPIVTWEKTRSYNVALDVDFLRHFTATAEYYRIRTYDILGSRIQVVPPTFPRQMPSENYGEMQAQGVELTVGYHNNAGSVNYYFNANASYGGSKYIAIDQNLTYPYQDQIGTSPNRIVARVADHMLRTQADLDAFVAANPNYKYYGSVPALGQLVYKDLNGPNGVPDGIINDWDKEVLKNNNNPIRLGLNFGFEWKGFTLDGTLSGNLKQYVFVNNLANNVEWNRNWVEWYSNSWTPENPNAGLPKRYSANDGTKGVTNDESSFWLANSSFLRLRLLNVGYHIPSAFTNKFGVKGIKVYFSGTNLFVISKFNRKYYDPEMGNHANYPVMKNFNFGLNVTL
jgi:TonB-linked SusC/RagA family outer membrane protein